MEEIRAEGRKILVSHFNIRQSISILLIKLVLVDLISAVFFILIFSSGLPLYLIDAVGDVQFFGFLALVIFKVGFTIFLVLQWLNEYWEITPEKVVHRKGIIYKSERTLSLEWVREVKVSQGFLGELCNFGTINIFDMRLQRNMDMYMVHNPRRYLKILESVIPDLEEEKDIAGKHLTREED